MSYALKIVVGVMAGGGLGYGLSQLACASGSCPLTSNRWLMLAVGACLGGLLALSGCSGEAASEGGGTTDQQGPVATEGQIPAAGQLTTAEQFQAQVIKPGKPAVVDFYADWCGYCQQLKPVLRRLESEYAGTVAFFRVDTDAARELASQHSIRYLPTLLLYAAGQQVDRMEGAPTESQLRQRLGHLAQGK